MSRNDDYPRARQGNNSYVGRERWLQDEFKQARPEPLARRRTDTRPPFQAERLSTVLGGGRDTADAVRVLDKLIAAADPVVKFGTRTQPELHVFEHGTIQEFGNGGLWYQFETKGTCPAAETTVELKYGSVVAHLISSRSKYEQLHGRTPHFLVVPRNRSLLDGITSIVVTTSKTSGCAMDIFRAIEEGHVVFCGLPVLFGERFGAGEWV